MGYGDVLVHQRGGPRFHKHRRIVQDHFSAKSLTSHVAMQRMEVYTTLVDIGNTPNNLDKHLKRYDSFPVLRRLIWSHDSTPFTFTGLVSSLVEFSFFFGPPDWAKVYGLTKNPAAGMILSIAYGYKVHNCEDPFITLAEEATRNTVKAGGPGAMLCDMFPPCKLDQSRIS